MLSTQGPQSADQRFGVLLSLTRGAILDPELAVSYALELGKDNASYMRAVLEATAQKNYSQLAQAFKMTCIQRFGVEKAAEICKDDALAERSDAIAQVVQDEMEAVAAASQPPGNGPLAILKDEREVQSFPGQMAWLFEPYLQDLYERRQWQEIERFEKFSPGAQLVGGAGAGDRAHRRAGQRRRERRAGQVPRRPAQVADRLPAGPQLRSRLPRQAGRRDVVVVRRGGGRLRRAAASACCGSRTPRPRRRSGTCTRACSGARSTPTISHRSATVCWCRC